MQGRGTRPAPGPRQIGRKLEVRRRPLIAPTACTRPQRWLRRSTRVSIIEHCTWDGHTAMPRCPPGSMLHSCAEVRERFDPNRPAANHTLPAALIQGHGTGASGTVEETLQPRSTIGCSAWPCKLIVGFVMETDLRPQSKGGRVCKEASSTKQSTIVVLIVLNLAPRDLSEASMGCVRVRGWLRRTASPGKLVARLFRCEPWPGPGWAGTRTHWGHRSGKGSLLAACAAEHNE